MSDLDITTAVSLEKVSTPPPQDNQDQRLIKIWPPTQRTREAVINRLIKTLSTRSRLFKRYGTIPFVEASAAARQIEDMAFAAADSSFAFHGDGIEILHVYSNVIRKMMLETAVGSAASADQTPPVGL